MNPSARSNGGSMDQGWYLISFSPANGIGFYESADSLFVLDLIASQDLKVESDVAGYILTLTGDQLEAGLLFESKDLMLRFMQREYFTDKKNKYYAELLTSRMDEERRDEILQFLNDDQLRLIKISDVFVNLTSKLVDQSAVLDAIKLSQKYNLTNVQDCLLTDFAQIVLSVNELEAASLTRSQKAMR